MNSSLGILELIGHAGLVGQLVLLSLIFTSILSWALIFSKRRALQSAQHQNKLFLASFWKSKNIDEVHAKSASFQRSPVAAVFKAGVEEMNQITTAESAKIHPELLENIQRSLMRTSQAEVAKLERNLSWLATTASASPFVGLFGTVWGIMSAFQNIGATGSANLAVVAPGISEALITTAAGIAVAIPAVIAYNHFSNSVRRQIIDIDCFIQDFLNIIKRSSFSSSAGE